MSQRMPELLETANDILATKRSARRLSGFSVSLKTLLIGGPVLGAVLGIMLQLLRNRPEVFFNVLYVFSTIVPFLLAIITVIWLGVRYRNLKVAVWGIAILLMPVIGIGSIAFLHRKGGNSPGGLGLLPTSEILQKRLPKQIDEPWVWNELEKRLTAGTLNQTEVDLAISELIRYMKTTQPMGWNKPLSWQRDFLTTASKASMITDKLQIELCDAFYASKPAVGPLERLREGSTGFSLNVQYGSLWDDNGGLPLRLLMSIERVLLDNQPILVRRHHQSAREWIGYYGDSVPVGEHTVTVEYEAAYVDSSKMFGSNLHQLKPAQWPTTVKRWNNSVQVPLNVYSKQTQIVQLATDPSKLVARHAGIQIERLVVQPVGPQGKKIILKWKSESVGDLPISFDVIVSAGDQQATFRGGIWQYATANQRMSGSTELEATVDMLNPIVQSATILLQPNPMHIERLSQVNEIWGTPVTINNVPLERIDLESETSTSTNSR